MACRAIEALRTWMSAQLTIAGSGSLAATLKKPPKKKVAGTNAREDCQQADQSPGN